MLKNPLHQENPQYEVSFWLQYSDVLEPRSGHLNQPVFNKRNQQNDHEHGWLHGVFQSDSGYGPVPHCAHIEGFYSGDKLHLLETVVGYPAYDGKGFVFRLEFNSETGLFEGIRTLYDYEQGYESEAECEERIRNFATNPLIAPRELADEACYPIQQKSTHRGNMYATNSLNFSDQLWRDLLKEAESEGVITPYERVK